MYWMKLASPLGPLTLASDGEALTGLWLEGQKYFAAGLDPEAAERLDLPVFRQAAAWLEAYFARQDLPALPSLAPRGSAFRQMVWKALLDIPYGQTCTYKTLAEKLGSSPRAVGGAVGHNPISLLIPCHRVLGAGGSLTGYAGGVEKKRFLLELERAGLDREAAFRFAPTVSVPTPEPDRAEPKPEPGKFPCPCCGCRTFPVPREEAAAFICPVCFWENDVFDPGEDRPSDENHGMTLLEGRAAYKKLGAVREEFLQYVRKPLPGELP